MSFNYRLIQRTTLNKEIIYGIHLVGYDKKGKISWVADVTAPLKSECSDCLGDVVDKLQDAFRQPMLIAEELEITGKYSHNDFDTYREPIASEAPKKSHLTIVKE